MVANLSDLSVLGCYGATDSRFRGHLILSFNHGATRVTGFSLVPRLLQNWRWHRSLVVLAVALWAYPRRDSLEPASGFT